jgi:hypothetical protein
VGAVGNFLLLVVFVLGVIWIVWRAIGLPRGRFTESDQTEATATIDRYFLHRDNLGLLLRAQGPPACFGLRPNGSRHPVVMLRRSGFTVRTRAVLLEEAEDRLTAAGIEYESATNFGPTPPDADAAQLLDLALAVHSALGSTPKDNEWRWKIEYPGGSGE